MTILKRLLLSAVLLTLFAGNAAAWEVSFLNRSNLNITWEVYGNNWGQKTTYCTGIKTAPAVTPTTCILPWGIQPYGVKGEWTGKLYGRDTPRSHTQLMSTPCMTNVRISIYESNEGSDPAHGTRDMNIGVSVDFY